MLKRRLRGTLATCALMALTPLLSAPGGTRTYAGGNFSVEIAGMNEFFLKSFAGADAVAVPMTRTRPDGYVDKNPGAPKVEDAELQTGFSAPKQLWDWVGAFATPAKPLSKEVTVNLLDFDLKNQSKRQLGPTSLSKVVFPACDAASKEPAYVSLALTPTRAHEVAGSGVKSSVTTATRDEQKNWVPSNFRLTINGLDTTKVSKIGAITLRHPAGSVEYSNLVITLADTSSASLKQWMKQVLDPESKGATAFQEKQGKLEFLAPNRQTVLLTLAFEGIGPIRLSYEKGEANAESIKQVTAELYVEKIAVIAP